MESKDRYEMAESLKRKRVVLTLEEKFAVIEEREQGYTFDSIAKRYNIGASTVKGIVNKAQEISNRLETNQLMGIKNKKTLKESSKPLVEQALYEWCIEQTEKEIEIVRSDIFEKAREINAEIEFDINWKPSDAWLNKFRERYGIIEIKVLNVPDYNFVMNFQHNHNKSPVELALESAENLLQFVSSRDDFALKDQITIRMIRDKLAAEITDNDKNEETTDNDTSNYNLQ